MYTIGIKGKGYYSGLKNSGRSKSVSTERKNEGEFKIDKITDSSYTEELTTIIVTIPMKRLIDDVDNGYIFSTKEEAEKQLENIKDSLEYDSNRDYHYSSRTYKDWRSSSTRVSPAHSNQTRYDRTKAWVVYDKLEVLDDEVTLKKKSRFNIKNYAGRLDTCVGTHRTCQFCNVEINKGEPFYNAYKFDLCNHCVQNIANELGAKFDACPESKDWSTAWLAERVTRDV